ncbi:hypothetical protein CXB51_010915 [Gossypium anomalum]|uniref:Reverse transcriptase Ty1/copia-type domain-containing protein n=1 Tax=Gossypium anomalum TaxID=47600 RepID=A0A8J6D708_9ROSI|nr:hypothetical protein CXB51_010915 [Gossypium anomalum]
MHQPPGYEQYGSNGNPLACRLKKALYGLRRAPRAWFEKLKQFLVSVGFVVSKSDASLFVRVISGSTLYILVYVNDIIITGNLSTSIDWFIQLLNSTFSFKDMSDLYYFLRIEVTRSSGCLHLCQKKYIHDILDRCSMTTTKSVHTPMVSSSTLAKSDGECLEDLNEYKSLTGALQYVVLTRLDIAYAENRICQFMHNSTTAHMIALKHILRYLCGTLDFGLVFRPSAPLSLVGYADANWGLDFYDQRLTSGYFTTEVTWLLSLLQELKLKSDNTPNVWCDSSSAVVANPVLHSKFKHVKLDLFFVREKVADGSILVGEVPTCDQVADVLTKTLSVTYFTRLLSLLRVLPVEKMGE